MHIVITPSAHGHFLNYFQLIRDRTIDEVELSYIDSRSQTYRLLKTIQYIYTKLSQVESVILLHGDHDIFIALAIKICFRKINIKSIIYYSYQNKNLNFIQKLKARFICGLSYLDIKFYLLEYNPGKHICQNTTNFIKLHDPVLTMYKAQHNKHKLVQKSNAIKQVNYLISGYIDDRKNIPLIISVFEKLSHDKTINRKLIILGNQSKSVQQFLSNYVSVHYNFQVKIIQGRYSDEELEQNIIESDIILAIYQHHYGSSGMIINAIYYSKKVIFFPVGVLYNFALELNITNLPQSLDVISISNSIKIIESMKRQYSMKIQQKFLDKRSQSEFVQTLFLGIK